jgi:hypothetical protein
MRVEVNYPFIHYEARQTPVPHSGENFLQVLLGIKFKDDPTPRHGMENGLVA